MAASDESKGWHDQYITFACMIFICPRCCSWATTPRTHAPNVNKVFVLGSLLACTHDNSSHTRCFVRVWGVWPNGSVIMGSSHSLEICPIAQWTQCMHEP